MGANAFGTPKNIAFKDEAAHLRSSGKLQGVIVSAKSRRERYSTPLLEALGRFPQIHSFMSLPRSYST